MPNPKQGKLSLWPSYVLAMIGTAWLLSGAGLLDLQQFPLGPIAVVWASLSLLLLARQISR